MDNFQENANKYNDLLSRNEIDLILISVENDGYLGLNGPGTSFDSKAHIIESNHKKKKKWPDYLIIIWIIFLYLG